MRTSCTDNHIIDMMNKIGQAQIGSCTCLTKTPMAHYHELSCRYRVLGDAWWMLNHLMNERKHQ